MPFEFIFPMSRFGQLSDVYGTAVSQYANTGGFPQGSGLRLGEFGLLFDGSMCRLLNAKGVVNQYDAVYVQGGNSNDYNVLQAGAVNEPVVAVNDRSGSTPLAANNIAWMSSRGIGTANVLAGLSANTVLVSSSTPGYLGAYNSGTANLSTGVVSGQSSQQNIYLLNATTAAGAYPVLLR